MNAASHFKDTATRDLWTGYLQQVQHLSKVLDSRQREDIEMEIKAHLLEGFIQSQADQEVERLQQAIQRLGEPETFIPQWVEDRLLEGAQPGNGMRNLFRLIRVSSVKGIRHILVSLALGLAYMFSFYLFSMAVLKVFFPDNVGFYLSPQGIPMIGYVDSEIFTEVLGNWLIPVFLMVSIVLLWVLSRFVGRRRL